MQWRVRNKKSLGNRVSWVYEHGAELEDEEGKYWLASGCLALEDSDDEDDSGPKGESESDGEPATTLIE
jgi:hypothetical protein